MFRLLPLFLLALGLATAQAPVPASAQALTLDGTQRVVDRIVALFNDTVLPDQSSDTTVPPMRTTQCLFGQKHAADQVFCHFCDNVWDGAPDRCSGANSRSFSVTFTGYDDPMRISNFGPDFHYSCPVNDAGCDTREQDRIRAKLDDFETMAWTFGMGALLPLFEPDWVSRLSAAAAMQMANDLLWYNFWNDEKAVAIYEAYDYDNRKPEDEAYFNDHFSISKDLGEGSSCIYRLMTSGTVHFFCQVAPAVWHDLAAPD